MIHRRHGKGVIQSVTLLANLHQPSSAYLILNQRYSLSHPEHQLSLAEKSHDTRKWNQIIIRQVQWSNIRQDGQAWNRIWQVLLSFTLLSNFLSRRSYPRQGSCEDSLHWYLEKFDDQKELYGTVSGLLFSRGITTKYCARSIDAGKSENLETIATSTLYTVE